MTAFVEPPSLGVSRIAKVAYAYARDAVSTLIWAIGSPSAQRKDDNAADFPYKAILRLTFGGYGVDELTYTSKRDSQKRVPKPFDEAFGEIPDAAREKSFALSILGSAGVALTLASVIGVAIWIDVQRLQPRALSSRLVEPIETTRPKDTKIIPEVSPGLDVEHAPSKPPANPLDQAAPSGSSGPLVTDVPPINTQPRQPSPQLELLPKRPEFFKQAPPNKPVELSPKIP